MFHVYASVLVSIEEENGLLDSIFSGWKFMPAGELRREIARSRKPGASPSVTNCSGRHAGGRRAAGAQNPPGSGPGGAVSQLDQLRRHGHRRHRRTRIRRPNGLSHDWRRRLHSALRRPGNLLRPADFVFAGVAVILVGMYVQWIRWRTRKPLAFARIPSGTSTFPREKGSVGGRDRGGDHFRSGDLWKQTGVSLHRCRAFLRHRLPFHDPEYGTYRLSPHAHVACAQCHIGQGANGYSSPRFAASPKSSRPCRTNIPGLYPYVSGAPDRRQLREVSLAGQFLRFPRISPRTLLIR